MHTWRNSSLSRSRFRPARLVDANGSAAEFWLGEGGGREFLGDMALSRGWINGGAEGNEGRALAKKGRKELRNAFEKEVHFYLTQLCVVYMRTMVL